MANGYNGIGNKNVRVGDYIWTDGRCVYGNQLISQKPLIITAPPDEKIIPIIAIRTWLDNSRNYQFDYAFYTFYRGKLKFVGRIDREPNDGYPEIFSTNKVIHNSGMMRNDSKGHVWFLSTSPRIHVKEEKHKCLITSNVNLHGDVFEMVYNYIDDHSYSDEEEETREYSDIIEIRKNGKIVQTVDLEELFGETYDKVEEPAFPNPQFEQQRYEMVSWDAYDFFIEDDENWRFTFKAECTKGYIDELVDDITHEGEGGVLYGGDSSSDKASSDVKDDVSEDEPISTVDNIKFALQDGYYYMLTNPRKLSFAINMIYDIIFFTPRGTPIITMTDKTLNNDNVFSIARVGNNSYLLNGRHVGLLLYKNGVPEKLNLLDDVITRYLGTVHVCCINQRLRSMKNIKHWERQIKELQLKQEHQ